MTRGRLCETHKIFAQTMCASSRSHPRAHACRHSRMNAHARSRTRAHTHAHARMKSHKGAPTLTHTHTHTDTHTHTHTHTFPQTLIRAHAQTHARTHTHAQMRKRLGSRRNRGCSRLGHSHLGQSCLGPFPLRFATESRMFPLRIALLGKTGADHYRWGRLWGSFVCVASEPCREIPP